MIELYQRRAFRARRKYGKFDAFIQKQRIFASSKLLAWLKLPASSFMA